MKRLMQMIGIAGGLSLMVVTTACQSTAKIGWNKPAGTGVAKGGLYSEDTAYSGANTVVGRHKFTVFAFNVGSIGADQPLTESVTKAVGDALSAAGYEVKPGKQAPADNPVLKPILKTFNHWSYSWLWPLMLEGGGINLHLALEKSGTVLWSRDFEASSFWVTPGGAFGFDGHIKEEMTEIVKKITDAVSSEEFEQALKK